MSSITFLVESRKINIGRSCIFWHGQEIVTQGHLICSGNDHRFLVYFLQDNKNIPKPEYIKKYKLGAMFVKSSEMNTYISLSKETEPIYAYLNTKKPELNCLSINEPIKENMY